MAAAEAVESTGLAEFRYWEQQAPGGPYCSTAVCVGQARACDGLVLLLGETLTPITEREYRATKNLGALCVILAQQGSSATPELARF